ncbi:Retrovirus-related Pol polyprotein from transposon gypsy [Linum perenne]
MMEEDSLVGTTKDSVTRHEVFSFMDCYSGYNQIYIADEDIHKTAFCCPGAIGCYKWVAMPFGLKNAGTTYQRAMNTIFHELIGEFVEVYVDDIVVKSKATSLVSL